MCANYQSIEIKCDLGFQGNKKGKTNWIFVNKIPYTKKKLLMVISILYENLSKKNHIYKPHIYIYLLRFFNIHINIHIYLFT